MDRQLDAYIHGKQLLQLLHHAGISADLVTQITETAGKLVHEVASGAPTQPASAGGGGKAAAACSVGQQKDSAAASGPSSTSPAAELGQQKALVPGLQLLTPR